MAKEIPIFLRGHLKDAESFINNIQDELNSLIDLDLSLKNLSSDAVKSGIKLSDIIQSMAKSFMEESVYNKKFSIFLSSMGISFLGNEGRNKLDLQQILGEDDFRSCEIAVTDFVSKIFEKKDFNLNDFLQLAYFMRKVFRQN